MSKSSMRCYYTRALANLKTCLNCLRFIRRLSLIRVICPLSFECVVVCMYTHAYAVIVFIRVREKRKYDVQPRDIADAYIFLKWSFICVNTI